MSTTTVSDLARIIYENKTELALDGGFASKIEPAATDKDAFIVAHPGAAEYINDDTKSFMDRYSDVMYLGAARAQRHRLDLCRASTPRSPASRRRRPASSRPPFSISASGWNTPSALDALDELQDELEGILRGVVIGLRDGTISSDGLDTFKLGYEFVRDEIGMRRDHLKRHPPPQDDKVVTVKTAQSA